MPAQSDDLIDISHAHKNLIAMPLIMYIHNGQNHKEGYNIKVNEKVETGCEEPVGDIRRRSREQMVLSVEI
jgi:hypothetical protein